MFSPAETKCSPAVLFLQFSLFTSTLHFCFYPPTYASGRSGERIELFHLSWNFFNICFPDRPGRNAVVSQVETGNLILFGGGERRDPQTSDLKKICFFHPPPPQSSSEVSSDIPSSIPLFPRICRHSRRDAASLSLCQSFDISSWCRLLHSVSRLISSSPAFCVCVTASVCSRECVCLFDFGSIWCAIPAYLSSVYVCTSGWVSNLDAYAART